MTAGPPTLQEASHGQRRVWAAEQSAAAANTQTVPLAYRIEGDLDPGRLGSALGALVAAHEALHTSLVYQDGRLLGRPSRNPFRLEIVDVGDGRPALDFLARRFDIARDPMLKAQLLVEGPGRHVLLLVVHHSAGDGATFALMQEQIGRLYAGVPTDVVFREARPFSAYVECVRERADSGDFDAGLATLVAQYAGRADDDPEASSDLAVPPRPRHRRFALPETLHEAARRRGGRYFGLGPACVYLAAYGLFLATLWRKDHIGLGFPVANRAGPGHEHIVGFLSNIVPLVVECPTAGSLDDVVAAAAKVLSGARRRLDLPYGLFLERWRGDAFRFDRAPFEALFTFQPVRQPPLVLRGCEVTEIDPPFWPTPFPVMLDIEETARGASGLARWDATHLSDAAVEALCDHYARVVEALCLHGGRSASMLVLELDEAIAASRRDGAHAAAAIRAREVSALLRAV